MNYRVYMKRIESVLGQIRAADEAQENRWQEVVARELNEISKDCAMELQTETKIRIKGDYQFGLDEWPPTRILSLILALCAWLGWMMHEKHGSSEEHPFSPRACLRLFALIMSVLITGAVMKNI